jgi:hypothetical protein
VHAVFPFGSKRRQRVERIGFRGGIEALLGEPTINHKRKRRNSGNYLTTPVRPVNRAAGAGV